MRKHNNIVSDIAIGKIAVAVFAAATAVFAVCCTKEPTEIDKSGENRNVSFLVSTSSDSWDYPLRKSAERSEVAEENSSRVDIGDAILMHGEGISDSLYLVATVSSFDQSHGMDDMPKQCGVPVYDSDSENFNSFVLYASIYAKEGDTTDGIKQYIKGDTVRSVNNWQSECLWPNMEYFDINFFAYATASNDNVVITSYGDKGQPTISYTTPHVSQSQQDLMIASNSCSKIENEGVAFDFKHALTGVQFQINDNESFEGMKIDQIQFYNIYDKGTLPIGSSVNWTIDTSSKVGFVVGDGLNGGEGVEAGGNSVINLLADDEIFMMIPQTLPDDASVKIWYEISDGTATDTKSFTGSIGGTTWEPGKMITYRITYTLQDDENNDILPIFSVQKNSGGGTNLSYTYAGKSNEILKVQSYSKLAKDETQITAQPWTVKFAETENPSDSDFSETAPAWLKLRKSSVATDNITGGSGSSTATSSEYIYLSVDQQTVTYFSSHNTALQSAEEVTDLNLAGVSGSETTANCYIVNGPGTYKLPLVFGNALKSGSANEKAYTASTTSSDSNVHMLSKFVDYNGAAITSPYIYNQNSVADAILVWQDASNLLTDIKLSDDKRYLTFKVDKSTICQGNAVVAVRDSSGNIEWSWHIWVTDYTLGDDVDVKPHPREGYSGNVYTTMKYNLGYCDGDTGSYASRSAVIRFTQTNTGSTLDLTVVQNGESFDIYPNSTYYQWGRKDPSPGWTNQNGHVFRSKTLYYVDANYGANYGVQFVNSACDVQTGIKNPGKLYGQGTGVYSWMTTDYANLWEADANYHYYENGSVTENAEYNKAVYTWGQKTIYDPSPAGYMVPPASILSGMYVSEYQTSVSSDSDFQKYINTPYTSIAQVEENSGLEMYAKVTDDGTKSSGTTIFIPYLEYIDNGYVSRAYGFGFIWCRNPQVIYEYNYSNYTHSFYRMEGCSSGYRYNLSTYYNEFISTFAVPTSTTTLDKALPVRSIKEGTKGEFGGVEIGGFEDA